MRLAVTNEGETPIRVIADRDSVNDFTLEPNDTQSYETPPEGVIKFRELGWEPGDFPDEPGPFRTDWAGRSLVQTASRIDDYAETAAARRKRTAEGSISLATRCARRRR